MAVPSYSDLNDLDIEKAKKILGEVTGLAHILRSERGEKKINGKDIAEAFQQYSAKLKPPISGKELQTKVYSTLSISTHHHGPRGPYKKTRERLEQKAEQNFEMNTEQPFEVAAVNRDNDPFALPEYYEELRLVMVDFEIERTYSFVLGHNTDVAKMLKAIAKVALDLRWKKVKVPGNKNPIAYRLSQQGDTIYIRRLG